jgi:signal transduction histidine kinase
VLKGEISVALSRPRTSNEYRETLAQLEATVDDMSQMVEDLLTLTRASSSQQPPAQSFVDVGGLVQQVGERLQVIAAERGITLSVQVACEAGCVVMGDRIQLQRVFTNLMDNALRYTPPTGRVDVSVRRANASPASPGKQYSGKGHAPPAARAHQVVVEVCDTGHGIAPEHLPNLFQRFYRADSGRARESGGTGLGLAMARAIVLAHGGQITVTSQVGAGSCFTITLPACDQPVMASEPDTPMTTLP